MHHSIIIRAAVGLTIFLCIVALGFGWSTTHRERQFEAASAQAAAAAANAGAGPGAAAGTGPSPEAGRAEFDRRCTRCHEAEEVHEWLASKPAQEREAALVAFLDGHGKAPPDVNRLVAHYFSQAPAP